MWVYVCCVCGLYFLGCSLCNKYIAKLRAHWQQGVEKNNKVTMNDSSNTISQQQQQQQKNPLRTSHHTKHNNNMRIGIKKKKEEDDAGIRRRRRHWRQPRAIHQTILFVTVCVVCRVKSPQNPPSSSFPLVSLSAPSTMGVLRCAKQPLCDLRWRLLPTLNRYLPSSSYLSIAEQEKKKNFSWTYHFIFIWSLLLFRWGGMNVRRL